MKRFHVTTNHKSRRVCYQIFIGYDKKNREARAKNALGIDSIPDNILIDYSRDREGQPYAVLNAGNQNFSHPKFRGTSVSIKYEGDLGFVCITAGKDEPGLSGLKAIINDLDIKGLIPIPSEKEKIPPYMIKPATLQ